MILCFLLFAYLRFQAVVANPCEDGWRYSPHSQKCYRFFNDEKWPSAELECLFHGAHHASVHSKEDILFLTPVVANPCEDGWRYSPHSQKCYRFFNDEKWPSAELECLFHGAHHASVHSKEDILFLTQLARGAQTIWLGAAQFGASRDYVWTDHSPFDFENWQYGVRPPYDVEKKCTKMNILTGEWFHSCCQIPSPYICEMNAKEPLPIMPLFQTQQQQQQQTIGLYDSGKPLSAKRKLTTKFTKIDFGKIFFVPLRLPPTDCCRCRDLQPAIANDLSPRDVVL
ncbi:Lymphocyte antigen 75 [Toxocara canis]|uniref:Lymphocyte antigen 75 n=1 Tax=Toxocara canis TaxID=6265 RepID=A0A0B2UYP0_TOXCA|nr:Lymphocyte antigen 75 [Toxocara canis]